MNNKRSIVFLLVLVMLVSGCVTAPAIGVVNIGNKKAMTNIFNEHKNWDEKTRDSFINGRLQVGMNKVQVLYLGNWPSNWSKHKVGEDIYETWIFSFGLLNQWTWDFKNGILTGYSMKQKYYSSDGVEDLKKLK